MPLLTTLPPCSGGESQSGYYFLLNILYVNKKIVSNTGCGFYSWGCIWGFRGSLGPGPCVCEAFCIFLSLLWLVARPQPQNLHRPGARKSGPDAPRAAPGLSCAPPSPPRLPAECTGCCWPREQLAPRAAWQREGPGGFCAPGGCPGRAQVSFGPFNPREPGSQGVPGPASDLARIPIPAGSVPLSLCASRPARRVPKGLPPPATSLCPCPRGYPPPPGLAHRARRPLPFLFPEPLFPRRNRELAAGTRRECRAP